MNWILFFDKTRYPYVFVNLVSAFLQFDGFFMIGVPWLLVFAFGLKHPGC